MIETTTRASTEEAFGTPTPVAFLTSTSSQKWFDVCSTGYYLVSRANGSDGQDFFEGQFGSAPTDAVTILNSPNNEISTFLSFDCDTLYFASNRPVAGVSPNPTRIYMSTRPNPAADWTAPVAVSTFGETQDDEDLYITPDGHTAVLASTRGTTMSKDIFQSTR